jgi:N-acetylmuramoyl-L-alanine amidase
MLLDFFQLRDQPFGVSPDPAYLYPSRTHCEALDSLTEAILSDRGFLALIGESGMGKTTLLNQVLEGMRDTTRAIFLRQTQCSSREFFEYLMSELGVRSPNLGLVAMRNKLNEILFAEMLAGRRFVLIVDEAQNLDESVLETIRLLSNFETPNYKLIQIMLAGQPQLQEKLQREQLAQLAQRITVMKYLEPLSGAETSAYVQHRLRVAGHPDGDLFEREALALIAERSRGIPRNINKICFRTLLDAHAEGCRNLSPEIVERAAGKPEFFSPLRATPNVKPAVPVAAALRKPRLVAAARRKPQPTFTWLPVSSGVILRGAIMAALTVTAMVLPYRGVRRIKASLGADWAMCETMRHEVEAAAKQSPESVQTVASPAIVAAMPVSKVVSNSSRASTRDPQEDVSTMSMVTTVSHGVSLARELGLKIGRIAIDPGHGGYDTGTQGPNGLMEKDLCLDVALRLGQLIKENIPGAEVVYTRTDDRHVPLEERTAIVNDAKADLFISIHANSSASRETRGAETYYVSLAASPDADEIPARENAVGDSSLYNLPELIKKITRNEYLTESRHLAQYVQTALAQRLQVISRQEKNRGVKRAPFIVLTGANMPAVLSEISFVSNPSDESLLFESAQRERISEGLYRGIVTYLGSMPARTFAEQRRGKEEHRVASSEIAGRTGR